MLCQFYLFIDLLIMFDHRYMLSKTFAVISKPTVFKLIIPNDESAQILPHDIRQTKRRFLFPSCVIRVRSIWCLGDVAWVTQLQFIPTYTFIYTTYHQPPTFSISHFSYTKIIILISFHDYCYESLRKKTATTAVVENIKMWSSLHYLHSKFLSKNVFVHLYMIYIYLLNQQLNDLRIQLHPYYFFGVKISL